MQIEMRLRVSGTRDGVDWPAPGETVDLPDGEAAQLIEDGAAIPAAPVDDAPRRARRKAED